MFVSQQHYCRALPEELRRVVLVEVRHGHARHVPEAHGAVLVAREQQLALRPLGAVGGAARDGPRRLRVVAGALTLSYGNYMFIIMCLIMKVLYSNKCI